MSANMYVEFLAVYGQARARLLDKIRAPRVLGEQPMVHAIAVMATFGVVFAIFAQIRALTLFSL
jgi:hypothetical protein